MRNYWLKILLGAAAVFAVGMLIVSGIRHARGSIEEIAEGTGPIAIPLAFVPLEVDGQRAGTIRRLVIFRDSLQEPTRFEVTISSDDTAAVGRLGSCILAIEPEVAGSTRKTQPNRFRCYQSTDTVGKDLQQFGDLRVRETDGRFPLFAPRDQLEDLRNNSSSRLSQSDSIGEAVQESLEVVGERQADSIMQAAESAHRAAVQAADSARQGLRRAPLP